MAAACHHQLGMSPAPFPPSIQLDPKIFLCPQALIVVGLSLPSIVQGTDLATQAHMEVGLFQQCFDPPSGGRTCTSDVSVC